MAIAAMSVRLQLDADEGRATGRHEPTCRRDRRLRLDYCSSSIDRFVADLLCYGLLLTSVTFSGATFNTFRCCGYCCRLSIFIARRYASAVFAVAVCLSVCRLCPSQSGIVSVSSRNRNVTYCNVLVDSHRNVTQRKAQRKNWNVREKFPFMQTDYTERERK